MLIEHMLEISDAITFLDQNKEQGTSKRRELLDLEDYHAKH